MAKTAAKRKASTTATGEVRMPPTPPLISIDPSIMLGKPCIAGTRVTVEIILRRFAEGYTMPQILDDYPHLTAEGVRAALDYAATLAGQTSHGQAA